MNRTEWLAKRKELMEIEKLERSEDWQASRAPLQAAITEQAVRDLYGRLAKLEVRVNGRK